MTGPLGSGGDDWNISGAITVSVEVEREGVRRNVVFSVPDTDTYFSAMVDRRWRRSFQELAYQATQTKEA